MWLQQAEPHLSSQPQPGMFSSFVQEPFWDPRRMYVACAASRKPPKEFKKLWVLVISMVHLLLQNQGLDPSENRNHSTFKENKEMNWNLVPVMYGGPVHDPDQGHTTSGSLGSVALGLTGTECHSTSLEHGLWSTKCSRQSVSKNSGFCHSPLHAYQSMLQWTQKALLSKWPSRLLEELRLNIPVQNCPLIQCLI